MNTIISYLDMLAHTINIPFRMYLQHKEITQTERDRLMEEQRIQEHIDEMIFRYNERKRKELLRKMNTKQVQHIKKYNTHIYSVDEEWASSMEL